MACSEKILISRCFLGDKVKYNGSHNLLLHKVIEQWKTEQRLVPICPEVCGGLSTPRPPAEIINGAIVMTAQGEDVSKAFEAGAIMALKLCQQHNITLALLKESSPSCGSNTIYDGSFRQTKIKGEGVTTTLLRQHGVSVFSENTIEQLILTLG